MDNKEYAALVAKTLTSMKSGKLDPAFLKTLDEALGQFNHRISDWMQPDQLNVVPGRETIVYGPTEASSGAGASRMVNHYSDFAPQAGITELYNQMSKLMEDFKSATSAKSKPEEDDEKSEMVEKAKNMLRKARKLISKAEDAEDEDDEADEAVEKARKSLEKAKTYLVKAEDASDDDDEEVEKSLKVRKSLQARLAEITVARKNVADTKLAAVKAREAVLKAEEDAKRAKEDADKADEEAKKAKEDADKLEAEKANQSASADPVNHNQDASAKMATKTAREFINTVMGAHSVNPALGMQKSVSNINTLIDSAEDSGSLTGMEAVEARNMVGRIELAKSGAIKMETVEHLFNSMSSNLSDFFNSLNV